MVHGMNMMLMRKTGMIHGFFMESRLMIFGGFFMMTRRKLMMLSGFLVVLDHARKGDVVIVWKLDRLERS